MLVPSFSMAVWSCWIVAGTGTHQSIPIMLNGWLTGVSMLAMQELGCFQLLETVYRSLQHGAVHYYAATCGDGRGWMAQQWASGSHHGSSAINKMHLCSLSIPTATMGHLVHNIDISKPLTHTIPHTLSAICSEQWKPIFIREENTSSMCQTLLKVKASPVKSVTTWDCSQVESPMSIMSMQMSFLLWPGQATPERYSCRLSSILICNIYKVGRITSANRGAH